MVAVLCVLVDGGVGAALSEEGRRGEEGEGSSLVVPSWEYTPWVLFFFVLFFRFFVLVLGPSVACSVACRGLDGPPHRAV